MSDKHLRVDGAPDDRVGHDLASADVDRRREAILVAGGGRLVEQKPLTPACR